jgi:hypothetical protein
LTRILVESGSPRAFRGRSGPDQIRCVGMANEIILVRESAL